MEKTKMNFDPLSQNTHKNYFEMHHRPKSKNCNDKAFRRNTGD